MVAREELDAVGRGVGAEAQRHRARRSEEHTSELQSLAYDIHASDWSSDVCSSDLNAEAEVRRYCAEAAYPLCYAVGRRELLKLRDDYRAARGADFTLAGFHGSVLQYGGLPVALIRWGLNLSE